MDTSSFLNWVLVFDSDSNEKKILQEEAEELQEIANICHEAYGSTSQKHGRSVVGRKHVNCNQFDFHKTLMQDYFNPNCTYGPDMFGRRYRMRRDLFLRILTGIQNNDKYFIQKLNASKTQRLSGEQKMTVAQRMLACGTPTDALDDAYRIVETTALETLDKFCQSVVDVFSTEFEKCTRTEDGLEVWTVCIGNGRTALKHTKELIMVKKENQLLFWKPLLHTIYGYGMLSFGIAGSNNDLNVIERSHLSNDLALGRVTSASFTLRQNTYEHGYYLSDGIYSKWSTIVKTCQNPITAKQAKFAAMQEGQRKDVESAFGVLQSRFAMISNPCRLWSREKMFRIMFACIIMDNMIIEDERDMEEQQRHYKYDGAGQMPEVFQDDVLITEEAFNIHVEQQLSYRDAQLHKRLQKDLLNHIWNYFGDC